MINYKLKEVCYTCGYWDKSLKRFYKCHGIDCPATKRDKDAKT